MNPDSAFTRIELPARNVRSLCFRGDTLVDWVGGGRTFELDGSEAHGHVAYSYRFDAVAAAPDGRHVVLYERLGTKGLVLKDGKILRQIDRDFYHADAYEFPVAIFSLPDGRLCLAHCPEHYCQLELDELETGQRLTAGVERDPEDFFHSRLSPSPGGTRLASAGWLWHPWDAVSVYDVQATLVDPRHLDSIHGVSPHTRNVCLAEESAAAWLDEDHLIVAASTEDEDPEEASEAGGGPRLLPGGLAVFNVRTGACVRATPKRNEPAGILMPVGPEHAVSFYGHPKLLSLTTGEPVLQWSDLRTGRQASSILWHLKGEDVPPPMALDPRGARFAVADEHRIVIIRLTL